MAPAAQIFLRTFLFLDAIAFAMKWSIHDPLMVSNFNVTAVILLMTALWPQNWIRSKGWWVAAVGLGTLLAACLLHQAIQLDVDSSGVDYAIYFRLGTYLIFLVVLALSAKRPSNDASVASPNNAQ